MTLTVISIEPAGEKSPARLTTTAGVITVWPDRLPRGPNGPAMPPTGVEIEAELTTRARGRFTDSYMDSWDHLQNRDPGDESDAHLKATAMRLAYNELEPMTDITNRAQEILDAMRNLN